MWIYFSKWTTSQRLCQALLSTNTKKETLERARREKDSKSGFPDENITYKNMYQE